MSGKMYKLTFVDWIIIPSQSPFSERATARKHLRLLV